MGTDLESREAGDRGSAYIFDLGDGFAVDARPKGNKTRRMNHADGPLANVRANVINHYGIRKVCMYAAREIAAHDELLFDYGPKYWSKPPPEEEEEEEEEEEDDDDEEPAPA
eukprot:COSAG06_NODE_13481_length_1253_cov_2.101386_2_plen_112_part_00